MRSRTLPILPALALAGLALPAAAEGFRGIAPAYPAYGEAGPYGYAGEFVRGTYVGAPFTRVPRPSEIVPTPWSYGTYGIPTVSGIPAAPVAAPTLTVIDGRGPAVRGGEARGGDARGAGVRIIQVQVPRR